MGLAESAVGTALQRGALWQTHTRRHTYSWHPGASFGSILIRRPARLLQVVVYYTMYEACQLLWAETLYNKSVPGGLQFYIYGVVMLCEYFSMIYCRSLAGIRYFPRYTTR